MDPFDNQMHVSWYHAIDTTYIHIFVKFERMFSISILRNKAFFAKRSVEPSFAEKDLFLLFPPKLNRRPTFKFGRYIDVRLMYCMIPRTLGVLGWGYFFCTLHSNRSIFGPFFAFTDAYDIKVFVYGYQLIDMHYIALTVKFDGGLSISFLKKKATLNQKKGVKILRLFWWPDPWNKEHFSCRSLFSRMG
jgi:hypothetical protein